jgi:hypothetical protein
MPIGVIARGASTDPEERNERFGAIEKMKPVSLL